MEDNDYTMETKFQMLKQRRDHFISEMSGIYCIYKALGNQGMEDIDEVTLRVAVEQTTKMLERTIDEETKWSIR